MASGAFQTLEGSSDPGAGVSSKHDELAEAVQAALLSVYGETPVCSFLAEGFTVCAGLARLGPWLGKRRQFVAAGRDPELLRLPRAQRKGRGAVSNHTEARYNGDTPDVFGQPPDYASPQHRPQWSRSLVTRAEYDDLSPYPHSPGHAAPSSAAAERESSRLLGAAAIGLVGGIAIAASLAVFVINS